KRLDGALHQLPRDALPPVRQHHAGAAVVRRVAIETIEDEADQPRAVERADGEVRTVAAPDHQAAQILGGVVRRDGVVAEGVVERGGHLVEVDAGQRADRDHCATSSASPASRASNAERHTRATSGAAARTSGTPLRSMRNMPSCVWPMRAAGTPCVLARRSTSSTCDVLTMARPCDSPKRSATASTSGASTST